MKFMSKDKFLCTTQSIWLINYKVYHSKEYGVAKYILTYLKSFTTLWSKRILVKLFVKNCSFTKKKKKKPKVTALMWLLGTLNSSSPVCWSFKSTSIKSSLTLSSHLLAKMTLLFSQRRYCMFPVGSTLLWERGNMHRKHLGVFPSYDRWLNYWEFCQFFYAFSTVRAWFL